MLVLLWLCIAMSAAEPDAPVREPTNQVREFSLSAAQMLKLADRAVADGDTQFAVLVLTELSSDPRAGVRNEARFRLAMLATRRKDWAEAGVLLRRILDEDPLAQRARLELARVQAELGDISASQRTLREAQAGGRPPEVAQAVERFSAALRARKLLGANLHLAIAPDSNINRATRSTTLGTVLGEFELDDAARQSSGIGLTLATEAYLRRPLSTDVSLLARAGMNADVYRTKQFNDLTAIASVGPEFPLLKGKATVLFGGQKRWFGGESLYRALNGTLQWQIPLGRRSQMRTSFALSRIFHDRNPLQDSDNYLASVGYERALSARSGFGVGLSVTRQVATDPAYSSAGGQLSATAWREFGRSTVFANLTYSHLEADRRLSIYPARRKDDSVRLVTGATLRSLEWRGWAPQVKLVYERSWSPIEVYQFEKLRGEFGIARAF